MLLLFFFFFVDVYEYAYLLTHTKFILSRCLKKCLVICSSLDQVKDLSEHVTRRNACHYTQSLRYNSGITSWVHFAEFDKDRRVIDGNLWWSRQPKKEVKQDLCDDVTHGHQIPLPHTLREIDECISTV